MTPKQERFVQEYLIDDNATQAALRAGYKSGDIGRQLTKTHGKKIYPEVLAAIESAHKQRSEQLKEKGEVTTEYVVANLREVVERCLQRAPVLNTKGKQVQDEDGNNLWEFNASGANKALESLGKYLGMFTEKVQMDVAISAASIMSEVEKRRVRAK
jgi:phage terminase small subunit